jgi:arabinan endo-1,5-alpha-L-arabinosidase
MEATVRSSFRLSARAGVIAAALALVLPGVAAGAPVAGAPAAVDPPGTPPRALVGDTIVHDPSIVRAGGQWWVFFTGDPAINGGAVRMSSSRDGRTWVDRGTVTPGIPAWVQAAVPGVINLWAPDVSRHDGRWYLYYAASTFGSNRSIIGLMTNRTLDPASPDYRWVDRGLVLESVPTDDFNAIDPALTIDRAGRAWLSFGSFWSGIKMTRVSLPSGKPATTRPAHLDLVDRRVPPNAVEAPYVVRHEGWYYLFASFDFCCQGVNSTYRVVVGRSRSIGGPYVDRTGARLDQGGGSPFLDARGSMRGPGGESVSGDTFAFHYYDAADAGAPHLGLARLTWRAGWPVPTHIRISRP